MHCRRRRRPPAAFLRSFDHAEPLEARRLLVTLVGGVLRIDGTDSFRAIAITRSGTDLVVAHNGGSESFPIASVTRIDATLGAGDDLFSIADDVMTPASIFGGEGTDTISGGGGSDTIDGGRGTDLVSYETRVAPIRATLTAVFSNATSPYAYDTAIAGTGGAAAENDRYVDVEEILGGGGNDTIALAADDGATAVDFFHPLLFAIGNGGDDAISLAYRTDRSVHSFGGNLVADGGDGDDRLTFDGGTVGTLNGGAGDDTFGNLGEDSTASVDAGDGLDTFDYANASGVTYNMPGGLEVLNASGASIDVTGNDLANTITATSDGTISIDGQAGGDRIAVLVGSAGHATLSGGDGDDAISGGDADDLIYGGAGKDTVHAGRGDDTIYGQDGRDKIYGGDGNDRVDGGNSNDVLRGEDGDDKVYGRDGNDSVSGGEGRDSLYGDGGDDRLNGDGGRDICYGGAGTDVGAKQKIDRIFKEIELLL